MVNVRENLTGRRFGSLVVLCQAEDYVKPTGKHEAAWWVQCDCGGESFVVPGYNLKTGNTHRCRRCGEIATAESHHEINKYNLNGEYGIGWTNNTNREFYFDLEDYPLICDYCWSEDINVNGYSSLSTRDYKNGKKYIKMHYLLGFKGCDHRDRNALNNRKCNLRPATAQENARNITLGKNNTSGYIGVSYYKLGDKWRAYIDIGDNFISLGYYISKKDAIIARLKAERHYFGEFAPQSHLFKEYGVV